MEKRNRLSTLINNVANNKLAGKYNLAQYKEGNKLHAEKVKAMLHKKVCEDIVAFASEHKNIPLYFILSVGVSKGACKESEFHKGYKSFNGDKVLAVHSMAVEYNKYNGIKSEKPSDVTIRLIMRYYERKSSDMAIFLADLNNSKVYGKLAGSREIEYKLLCDNLSIPEKKAKESANEAA